MSKSTIDYLWSWKRALSPILQHPATEDAPVEALVAKIDDHLPLSEDRFRVAVEWKNGPSKRLYRIDARGGLASRDAERGYYVLVSLSSLQDLAGYRRSRVEKLKEEKIYLRDIEGVGFVL